eukprot:3719280-Amphidinium_carterae.1
MVEAFQKARPHILQHRLHTLGHDFDSADFTSYSRTACKDVLQPSKHMGSAYFPVFKRNEQTLIVECVSTRRRCLKLARSVEVLLAMDV